MSSFARSQYSKGQARLITPDWGIGESGKIDLLGATMEQHVTSVDIGPPDRSFYIPGQTFWYGQITTGLYIEWTSNKARWLILEDDTQTWQAMGEVRLTGYLLPAKNEPMVFEYEGVGSVQIERTQLQLSV
jgi:hypothetical protein